MFEDEIPAYCPEIEAGVASLGLRQGRHYDMVSSERASRSAEFTVHPIEDPSRSFLIDHYREQPLELSLTMIVSTAPCADMSRQGIARIRGVMDTLERLMARQSVATDAFLKIYTGIRTYSNMAIRSLDFIRDPETTNTVTIDIGLFEFRLAQSPRLDNESWLMDANNGWTDKQNQPLTMLADRPIVEATRVRRSPRMSFPLPSQEALVRTALRKLGVGQLRSLDVLSQTGVL